MGKGSAPRPIPDRQAYEDNWDRIFKNTVRVSGVPYEVDLPEELTVNIDTPCQQACKLNANEVCTGCGRSVNEISSWRHLSVAEKQQVNELAKIRLKTIVERKK